ncbi:hypothetical protein QTP88_000388 [Uroleucon formosanum]
MASTSASEVIINNVTEDTDIWSVGKCIICNMQLTDEPKMLSCLHLICKDCVEKENSVSGVECKCLTVTKGKLIDYPIESSNLGVNKDDNPNAIMTYPMLEEFPVCHCCTDTYADVYCTECSILLCQFCHLHLHYSHKYKVLEKFRKEINSNMLLEKFKLESNNKNIDLSLKETEKQIGNLEIKKRAIHEEIDKETELLHEEINMRAFEIKYLVDNCIIDTIGETYKNKQTLTNLQIKNEYYIEITKSVLNHNSLSDILNVSKLVLTQLENINNNAINISEMTSKLEIDLKNNFDETMDNCISTIKEIRKIVASPVFSLSKTNSINTSSNVDQTTVNLQLLFTLFLILDTENVDSGPINYVECFCCHQLDEQLVKCINCKRSYHNHCHMPLIPENVINNPFSFWRCTLCEYPKIFSKVLEDLKSTTYSTSIGEPGRKVIERILMELFCQNVDSVNFRDCPDKIISVSRKKDTASQRYLVILTYPHSVPQLVPPPLLATITTTATIMVASKYD